MAFALDTATQSRLGEGVIAALSATTPVLVNIDHHVSNERYGHFHYIDTDAPATAEMIHASLVTCESGSIANRRESVHRPFDGHWKLSVFEISAPTYRIAADLVEAESMSAN